MIIPRSSPIVTNRQTAGNISTQATQQAVSNFEGVTRIIDTFMDQRAESEALDAKNKLAMKRNEIINKARERQGDAAKGLTPELTKELESYEKEISTGLGKRTATKLAPYSATLKTDTMNSLVNYEFEQERKANSNRFNTGFTIALDTVKTDAKDWQRAKFHMDEAFNNAVNAGVFSPEEVEGKRAELDQKFRNEVGNNYYTQDKDSFIKDIDSFGFGKPEKQAWLDRYDRDKRAEERERKSLYSEDKARILAMKDDMKAQALNNENISYYMENATKLETMGFKNEARELREEGQKFGKYIEFMQENRGLPLSEIQKQASSLSVDENLEGSSLTSGANKLVKDEVELTIKKFKADPAAYVAQKAVGSTFEEIAESRIRLQKEQGLPINPRILTENEKQNFKSVWETGDTNAKLDLVKQASAYGKHTGKVLSEMGVSPVLQLAPLLPHDREAKTLISGFSKKSFKDFTEEGKTSYVSQAKNSEFYEMMADVQKQFPMETFAKEALLEVEKVMLGISENHLDPSAGPNFFKNNFNIINDSDKKLYLPKTSDIDSIEEDLDKRKQSFIDQALTKIQNTQDKATFKINARSFTWVNTASGVALLDGNGRMIPGMEVDLSEQDPFHKEMAQKKKNEINKVTQR